MPLGYAVDVFVGQLPLSQLPKDPLATIRVFHASLAALLGPL